MKQLLMGCAIVGLIALSPKTEARPPEVHIGPLPKTVQTPKVEVGMASWYGIDRQGQPTASGELFDNESFTAAHPKLPFGTKVLVTNLANFESALVRINDRGPGVTGRVLDVSTAAARQLGFLEAGLAHIEIDIVSYPGICARRIAASPVPDLLNLRGWKYNGFTESSERMRDAVVRSTAMDSGTPGETVTTVNY